MGRFLVAVLALGALGACKDKNKSQGLPPAQEWSANAGGPMMPQQGGAGPANPHGGAANPHVQEGSDLPEGHPPIDGVHGGGGGGMDVGAMGLQGPDPNRQIDPNNRVKGMIKVHAKAKDRVKDGGTVYLKVQRAVDGAPSGPPIAVDKLTWSKDGIPFEVTEAKAMLKGNEHMTGEVVVTARFDQDGDAGSKQPGDVSGSARVKVPADKVTITLDDVLQ